jgi:hypothetical protein
MAMYKGPVTFHLSEGGSYSALGQHADKKRKQERGEMSVTLVGNCFFFLLLHLAQNAVSSASPLPRNSDCIPNTKKHSPRSGRCSLQQASPRKGGARGAMVEKVGPIRYQTINPHSFWQTRRTNQKQESRTESGRIRYPWPPRQQMKAFPTPQNHPPRKRSPKTKSKKEKQKPIMAEGPTFPFCHSHRCQGRSPRNR